MEIVSLTKNVNSEIDESYGKKPMIHISSWLYFFLLIKNNVEDIRSTNWLQKIRIKIVSLHLEIVLEKEKMHKPWMFPFLFENWTIIYCGLKFLLLLIEGMRYNTKFLDFMVLAWDWWQSLERLNFTSYNIIHCICICSA